MSSTATAGRDEQPVHRPARRGTVPVAVAAAIGTTALVAAPAQAYVVRPGDTVSHIAARTGTSVAAIVAANGLRADAFIRAGQTLAIPSQATLAATAPTRGAAAGTRYTVRNGDTVSHIAARTGTTVAAIVAANGLRADAFIRAGQTLTVPGSGTPAAAPAPAAPAGAPSSATYRVKAGDTVSHIAARTGFTVREVLSLNGLSASDVIRPGQVLRLPGAAAPTPEAAPVVTSTKPYTVRSGDTLGHIAARQGTTVSALREANPSLDSRGTIRVGQTIRVPQGPAAMPSSFAGRTYPKATVSAAQANRDALAARAVPNRDEMRHIVADTARQWGVDPALALAIAYQESGFNMRAVSPANAVGVMQVIPSSGRWASDLAGRPLDLLDPHDNATAGVVILRSLTRSEPDDLAMAIAGYYQGLAGVRRNGMYPDTRRYVANIQTLMARFR
ncbi:MAG: LysM peptidoglycan-binding domain-containing protein [Actinomycetes bacterium]